MKRLVKELIGYHILANDGEIGKCNDLLFDEETWGVRYLADSYGFAVFGNKVLIPNLFIEEPRWEDKIIPVRLSKEEIKGCPDLDDNMPVSRAYEEKLNIYYKIDNYWAGGHTLPLGSQAVFFPNPRIAEPHKIIKETELETNLRSVNEVINYQTLVLNGEIGFIKDFILDDENWQIVYLVISTSFNKDILFPIGWIDGINFMEKYVKLDIEYDDVKQFPSFNPDRPIIIEYEKALYDFHGRKVSE